MQRTVARSPKLAGTDFLLVRVKHRAAYGSQVHSRDDASLLRILRTRLRCEARDERGELSAVQS